ncbi:MAG: glycosyltransferase [Candidatus Cloacimonetes bacterium]|nr:glycosyltransferase [Candidatus Cloacimonadota bacterium]
MKISFVIPVLNESQSIEQLYKEIIAEIKEHEYELVFVDDGSNDTSFEILQKLAENDPSLKIIKLRRNFGKAAALQSGFAQASGEIVFTMDSDLQDNPQEIGTFIKKIEDGYDLVSGWKKKRHDPFGKRLASRFFNFFTALFFKIKLHDFNCGFKAYRLQVVKELDIYGEMHRYIPVLAAAKGFRVTEIEVEHRPRPYGKSKYGKERFFRGFFDLLTVKLITNYVRSPLYLFGGLGLFLTLVGVLIGLYLSYLKFFGGMPLYNRPLLFVSILLIMVGLQFFSIGLIGELIVNQSRKQGKEDNISIEKTSNI